MELEKFLFSGEEIDHKALSCLAPMVTDNFAGLDPVNMSKYKVARCERNNSLMTGFVRMSNNDYGNLAFVESYRGFKSGKTPFSMVGFCYAKPTDMLGDMLPIECIKTKPRLALEALKKRLDRGSL